MTSRTKRNAGLLAVFCLCLAAAGVIVVQHRDSASNVSIADAGAAETLATPPAGALDVTPSAVPSPLPSLQATTVASPAATASPKSSPAKSSKSVGSKSASSKSKPVAKAPVAAPPAAAGPRVSSVKKGAALWNFSGVKTALSNSGVSWYYDWAAGPNGVSAPKGVSFVPMIWGASSVNKSTLATAKKSGTTLLGFNEPDMSGQANMTVDQALNLWPQLEATHMTLGSPAVAWGADQSGQWLDKFMTGAKQRGYRVDFITLHWYGSDFTTADAVSQLETYVKATYARYHKPIWITEYALMNFSATPKFPTPSGQAAFVKASTAMLQKLSYVKHYAWFAFPTSTNGADETGLYRPGAVATTVGKAYRAAGK